MDINQIKQDGIRNALYDNIGSRLYDIRQATEKATHSNYVNLRFHLTQITNTLNEILELADELVKIKKKGD